MLLNHGGDDLADAALQFAIVSDRRAHRDVGGVYWRNAECDELGCVDQEPRRKTFFKTVATKVAHLLSDQNQVARRAFVNTTFTRDDLGFHLRRRIVKLDRDKPLPRRLFQIFQYRLVTRVVRNDEHKIRRRFDDRAQFLDWKPAAVIRQRVNDYDRVFAGL